MVCVGRKQDFAIFIENINNENQFIFKNTKLVKSFKFIKKEMFSFSKKVDVFIKLIQQQLSDMVTKTFEVEEFNLPVIGETLGQQICRLMQSDDDFMQIYKSLNANIELYFDEELIEFINLP